MGDLWGSRITWLLISLAVSIKCLLMHSYRSTDFEVHRNWMAITHHTPLREWYFSELNADCTLDYPPLFAYLEKALSVVANLYDPDILRLQSEAHFTERTLIFQRASVIALDLVYMLCAVNLSEVMVDSLQWAKGKRQLARRIKLCLFTLLLFQPGLILLDNVHFQYNSFLFGLLLLVVAFITGGNAIAGAIIFSALVNFKHINLYYVPGVVAFYLGHYLLPSETPRKLASKTMKLGIAVLAPLLIAFGPFFVHGGVEAIQQIAKRLFPFKRGLTHSYWAPNVWALYNAADFALYQLYKLASLTLGIERSPKTPLYTRGIIGEDGHSVLPDVSPRVTLLLVVICLTCTIPMAVMRGKAGGPRTGVCSMFIYLTLSAYAFFLFAWHVHEKASLMMLIPITLLTFQDLRYLPVFFELLISSSFSLFPLFFTPMEQIVKYGMVAAYLVTAVVLLHYAYSLRLCELPIPGCYSSSLVALEIYKVAVHPRLFGGRDAGDTAEFLPLMATSVLCAIGVLHSYLHFLCVAGMGEGWVLEWKKWRCRQRETAINSSSSKRPLYRHQQERFTAGVDISFAPQSADLGVASYTLAGDNGVVEDFADEVVLLSHPTYIPKYLAIREAEPMARLTRRSQKRARKPATLLVDGNGVFHSRGCGLACHVGYLSWTRTVGMSKKLDGYALRTLAGAQCDGGNANVETLLVEKCEELSDGDALECRLRDGNGVEKTLYVCKIGSHLRYVSVGYDTNDGTIRKLLADHKRLSATELSDRRSRALVDELFNR